MMLIWLLGNYGKKIEYVWVLLENKENYIRFNVEIWVQLIEVSNKEGNEVRENIKLMFKYSQKFTPFSLLNWFLT